jgi:hypothetical protein
MVLSSRAHRCIVVGTWRKKQYEQRWVLIPFPAVAFYLPDLQVSSVASHFIQVLIVCDSNRLLLSINTLYFI